MNSASSPDSELAIQDGPECAGYGATKRRRLRRWLLAAGIAFASFVALSWGTVAYTSSTGFCNNCHYMEPYYESWRTSTHRNVDCVKCHYEPGFGSVIKGKMVGLAQLANYMASTERSSPQAQISDASCLRSGCHETRLLEGAVEYRGVGFDHKPHLKKLRRGKKLRCTSCHSQIVQGSHMTVTPTTCYLCHFKDEEFNEGTAGCTNCHAVPDKVYEIRGYSFNHSQVENLGLDCAKCHSDLVKGDGVVPPERCTVCHNRKEDLAHFDDSEFIHKNHVTDHKVDCLDCHLTIHHELAEAEDRNLASARNCRDCHTEDIHGAQVRMYAGEGAAGVEPESGTMFLVRADCKGCHEIHGIEAGAKPAWRPTKEACTSCHPDRIAAQLTDWIEILDDLSGTVADLLEEARGLREKAGPSLENAEHIDGLLAEAAQNYDFVKEANGVHNAMYATAVMEAAEGKLEDVIRLLETAEEK